MSLSEILLAANFWCHLVYIFACPIFFIDKDTLLSQTLVMPQNLLLDPSVHFHMKPSLSREAC